MRSPTGTVERTGCGCRRVGAIGDATTVLHRHRGAEIATNTIVLIGVVALAVLVLATTAIAVKHKTRTLGRDVQGTAVRDQAEAAELRAVYEKAVAEDDPATAYAAEAELTDTRLYGPTEQPTE